MTELQGLGWVGGWTTPGETTANIVIIEGPNGGEFVYDNSNNLRSANVGATTTDPVQDITCFQGFSTFNGFGAYLSLLSTSAAAPGFFEYFDNNSAVQGGLSYSSAGRSVTEPVTSTVVPSGVQVWSGPLSLQNGVNTGTIGPAAAGSFAGFMRYLEATGHQFDTQLVAVSGVFAANVAGTAVETWHTMTLLNSWTASGPIRYRKVASPANCVQLQGQILATAATSTTFFTLPAGYIPAAAGAFGCGANGNVSAASSPQVRWDTSGNLSVGSFSVPGAVSVWINGFVNLDA